MTATQTSPPTRTPWQQRRLRYPLKFFVKFLAVLLGYTAFIFGFGWLMLVPEMLINGPGPRDTIAEMVNVGLILTGGFIVFGAAAAALWPLASAPAHFTPSYSAVPATVTGHPFEVRYQRAGWGRTMSGKGTVRFDADGLAVAGYVTPSPLLQIIVVIVFTVVPLVLFSVGLGLIPALLFAHYLGRKHLVTTLPYHQLGDPAVQGCRVNVAGPGTPQKMSFVVADVDGERLYRELLPRFPGALGGWFG